MFKIKKVFVSIICALLLVTSFSTVISVSAKSLTFSDVDVENIDSYFCPSGSKVGLYCRSHWASVTTPTDNHKNSFKYVKETSYYYQNKKYTQQDSKHATGTSLVVSTPGSVTVDGYTQKVEFHGDLYSNASISSDIISTLVVTYYR